MCIVTNIIVLCFLAAAERNLPSKGYVLSALVPFVKRFALILSNMKVGASYVAERLYACDCLMFAILEAIKHHSCFSCRQ